MSRGRRRRRLLTAALALCLGAGLALVLAGPLEEKIREVTLPLRHDDIIRQQAVEKDLDPDLIAAVIYAESRFRNQTSDAGARGLMQITPQTAQEIKKRSGGITFTLRDLNDPDINIRYGSFYLRALLGQYGGNEVAALAAYNAGPTKVDSWGGGDLELDQIRLDETRAYVDDVLDKRSEYRDHYAEELGL